MASKEMMIHRAGRGVAVRSGLPFGLVQGRAEAAGTALSGAGGTWLLLGALVVSHNDRNQTVDWERGNVVGLRFDPVLAIVRYLRLALWPQGLVFDYGTQ